MHSVLEQRKKWQKQYISTGKTDLFYNSMGLCGNFTQDSSKFFESEQETQFYFLILLLKVTLDVQQRIQHHRKCHPFQMDITGKTTFRTTEKCSRSYMYTKCSFPNLYFLSPGSLFLAEIKNNLINFDMPCTINCPYFKNEKFWIRTWWQCLSESWPTWWAQTYKQHNKSKITIKVTLFFSSLAFIISQNWSKYHPKTYFDLY